MTGSTGPGGEPDTPARVTGAIFQLRFHQLASGVLVGATTLLAALLIATATWKFNQVAENGARERFKLLAASIASEFRHLLEPSAAAAQTQARLNSELFSDNGRLDADSMVPVFIARLGSDRYLYSAYFGLDNDDFLQVIAVRGDPKIITALSAPEGTAAAVRRIARSARGDRMESWTFLGENDNTLGQRSGDTTYFPTQRPWFEAARKAQGPALTDPYLFAASKRPGITIAHPLRSNIGVLGIDVDLSALQAFLGTLPLPPQGAVAILDSQGRILAASQDKGRDYGLTRIEALTPVDKAGSPHLSAVAGLKQKTAAEPDPIVGIGGEDYLISNYQFSAGPGAQYRVAMLAPVSAFIGTALEARNSAILMSVIFVAIVMPFAIIGARRVGRTLRELARDSDRIRRFDFAGAFEPQQTILYELDTLGRAQVVMKESLSKKTRDLLVAEDKLKSLVETGIEVSAERDREKLLRKILFSGKRLANCDAGTMYLMTERGTLRFALRTKDDALPSFEIPLKDADGRPDEKHVSTWVANHGDSIWIDDVYAENRFDLSGTRRFDHETGYRTVSMLTVPMKGAKGEVIGVLQYMNALDPETGAIRPFPPEIIGFVEALASQSAVALENQILLDAQKALVDAMIRLIAGAIDAKSPYTGGHCERVPELAIMLADEAARATEGPFAGFTFGSEEERREFRIGAWLHDCGKVTTPEYVVDKATKLETIYNRIHEVRMRFEVLLRDAAIERLEAIARGEDPAAADARLEAHRAELLDDFTFVAECNVGGEFMAPEKVERLKRISAKTWVRNVDDRLGLSQEELLRYEKSPPVPVPAVESLLADKPHHVVPRPAEKALDPKYGFKVKVPANLYNFGEVYNLAIGRGTLTEEERFKINEHIIQTIVMLEEMPFPKELKRVSEYAGTHHETLKGTGYPRALVKEQLSIPARIMAIADIFEALTASDRPYKKAKTLSESIKILSFFKKDGHIDPDLFDLFLTSGVHRRYAEKYLKPEQVDEVDVSLYVAPPAPVAA